jgi:hypothetical protein
MDSTVPKRDTRVKFLAIRRVFSTSFSLSAASASRNGPVKIRSHAREAKIPDRKNCAPPPRS